jgi:hypothetical protein
MYFLIFFEVLETESLVPTNGENVETYLTSYRIRKAQMSEVQFQCLYEFLSYFVNFVICFKFVTFFLSAVATNRWNIHHSVSKFNKSSSLYYYKLRFYGNIYLRKITQTEIYKLLIIILPNFIHETL